MAIIFHPKVGQIVMCDFTKGFREPEMVKKRPVVVISKPIKSRVGLVTVLPLSTTVPKTVMAHHCKLPKSLMPQLRSFQVKDTWVKGDMLYTVAYHRLNSILLRKRGQNGKRIYYKQTLGREQMQVIYACILHGLGIGGLEKFLDKAQIFDKAN